MSNFRKKPTNSLRSKMIRIVIVVNLLALSIWFLLQPTETASLLDFANELPTGRTAEEYLRCVGERLLVNAETRELQDNTGPGVIPLMVVPLMLDLPDFRELMCNLRVPVRRLVLVQNGREAGLAAWLAALGAAFGWSGRLLVRRHAENIGYSGAVNVGLRLAMALPREEAPFVFVTNSDVSLAPDFFPRFLREVEALTRHDAARMEELAAEVAREPDEYAPANRPLRVLRSLQDNNTLSTSALLPDRIRYAPLSERKKAFSNHYGFFSPGSRPDIFTSVIITRLAISTVGYFDENFYPAYVEDNDYILRLELLGFKHYIASYGNFVHRSSLNLRVSRKTQLFDALWYRRVYLTKSTHIYAVQKWKEWDACCNGYKEPFNGIVPLDVWIRDDALLNRLRNHGLSREDTCPEPHFNVSLLKDVMS